MGQVETPAVGGSETEVAMGDSPGGEKFVPVAESIRYRKRAQSAEKKVEELAAELAEAKAQAANTAEQLQNVQNEQKLLRKLAAAGAADLEAAVLIARARMEDEPQADVDGVIEQLRKEKQYLFAGSSARGGDGAAAQKTAGAKDKVASGHTVLDTAAKRAATSGNRIDLQRYLRLRRNFL